MNGSTRDSLDSAWDNGNWGEKEVGESRKDIALKMSRGGRSEECGLFGRWQRCCIGVETRLRVTSV
jgi:hypothetical protein